MTQQKYISKFTGQEIDEKLGKIEVQADGSVNIPADVTSVGPDGTVRRMNTEFNWKYHDIEVNSLDENGEFNAELKEEGIYTFHVQVATEDDAYIYIYVKSLYLDTASTLFDDGTNYIDEVSSTCAIDRDNNALIQDVSNWPYCAIVLGSQQGYVDRFFTVLVRKDYSKIL